MPKRERATLQTAREAVFSFLKETKGAVNWSEQDLVHTLKIPRTEAKQILPVLELQGYIQKVRDHKATESEQWITTQSGEIVAGARFPRFKSESVEQALKKLADHIASINREREQTFRITKAIAFGDFLSGRPQVQAADVGIQLERRKPGEGNMSEERAFLRHLRPKGSLIHLQPYEAWMEKRTYRKLALRNKQKTSYSLSVRAKRILRTRPANTSSAAT